MKVSSALHLGSLRWLGTKVSRYADCKESGYYRLVASIWYKIFSDSACVVDPTLQKKRKMMSNISSMKTADYTKVLLLVRRATSKIFRSPPSSGDAFTGSWHDTSDPDSLTQNRSKKSRNFFFIQCSIFGSSKELMLLTIVLESLTAYYVCLLISTVFLLAFALRFSKTDQTWIKYKTKEVFWPQLHSWNEFHEKFEGQQKCDGSTRFNLSTYTTSLSISIVLSTVIP